MAAHLEQTHPVLTALDVSIAHLCGLDLSSLSAAQLDAAEEFHTAQLRALRAAQTAAAVEHARAAAAAEAEREAMLRMHALSR